MDSVIGERCVLADHISTGTTEGFLEIEGKPTHSHFGAILGDNVTCGSFARFPVRYCRKQCHS